MINKFLDEVSIGDVRRSVRAPYAVDARIEIIGATKLGKPMLARTINASAFGLRIQSTYQISEQMAVRIWLKAPNHQDLMVEGYVRNASCGNDGTHQVGIDFDQMQPQLSATLIDAAAYGQ